MSHLSPRDHQCIKIAKQYRLYCHCLLCANNGEETPIKGDVDSFVAARAAVRTGVATIRWHVPCGESDPGAVYDLNTAEAVLRGLIHPNAAKAHGDAYASTAEVK